jgi:hypothetical protein
MSGFINDNLNERKISHYTELVGQHCNKSQSSDFIQNKTVTSGQICFSYIWILVRSEE